VGGSRCLDPDARLSPGTRVVVHVDERTAPEPAIVYEDEWLLVADKPAGMPSQATRADASGTLEAWARARHPEARLLHRLDRDASGLVILSLRGRAALQEALNGGRIDRRYLARVTPPLAGEGDIRLRIGRDPKDPRRRRALPENDPNGEPAHTHYRSASLVELTLDTGRTHQIRVHLSAIGHPIDGDVLYGGAPAERLMLHAHALTLPHPRDGRRLQFDSPAPFA
jgi:RluA family pseudouridine synthase